MATIAFKQSSHEMWFHENQRPYAICTALGWGLISTSMPSKGTDEDGSAASADCHRITATVYNFAQQVRHKEVTNPFAFKKMFELDFSEGKSHEKPMSQEDWRYLQRLKAGIHLTKDHFYKPHPQKSCRNPSQPVEKVLCKGPQYKQDYITFMNTMIRAGYTKRAPNENAHHGISCTMAWESCSTARQNTKATPWTNSSCRDLTTNSLLGVLFHFHQEPVALACDFEGMFHQVQVNEEHCDYLHFLWWNPGDTTKDPAEYTMTVHLFGAGSSTWLLIRPQLKSMKVISELMLSFS